MPFNIPKIPNLGQFLPRFGDMLREHRTLRGISVEELAAAANIASYTADTRGVGMFFGIPLSEDNSINIGGDDKRRWDSTKQKTRTTGPFAHFGQSTFISHRGGKSCLGNSLWSWSSW